MHSKNILFINRCFWPDSEATGQLLTELCEFLANRWHVSAVVGQPNWDTESDGFIKVGTQVRNDVTIHRLAHSQLPKSLRFARIRNLISFTLAVRKWGRARLKAEGLRLKESNAPSAPTPTPEGNDGDFRETGSGSRVGFRRIARPAETLGEFRYLKSIPFLTKGLGRFDSGGDQEQQMEREIVVCETDPFLLPLVVGPMARRRNARLVYYLQDIYPDVAVAVGVAKNSFFIRALRNRLKREYEKADAIIVLDEDMRDRLVGWGLKPEQLRIVPNWMDCSVVRPIKENNPFRATHQVNDKFVVMHSGNMGMTQRLDVLVDAMKSMEQPAASARGSGDRDADVVLLLVGNGAKRKSLEDRAANSKGIRFLDYQPRDKLSESLSAADLHVVSMDESITGCLAPSKLYGILASGTPVLAIVPKGNAVWRLVDSERLGWCVEPGDQQGIVAAIRAASVLDRNELIEMGMRGRTLAERLYDKRVCCEAFEEVIRRLV